MARAKRNSRGYFNATITIGRAGHGKRIRKRLQSGWKEHDLVVPSEIGMAFREPRTLGERGRALVPARGWRQP